MNEIVDPCPERQPIEKTFSSMAGMGVGAGSLKILTGVLVHRVTRPLRGSAVEITPLLSFTSEEKRRCPSVTQRAVGKGEVFTRQVAVFRVVVAGRCLVCRFT